MKIIFTILAFLILFTANAKSEKLPIFLDFKDLNQCIEPFNNFKNFKSYLSNCLKSKNIEINNQQINSLSPDDIDSINVKDISNIHSFIHKYPNYIYGADKLIKSYEESGKISQKKKEKLIVQTYNSFDPLLLKIDKVEEGNNSSLKGAILGGAIIWAGHKIFNAKKKIYINLSSSVSSITENSGTTVTITANLTNAQASALSINLSVSGSATEGTDYSSIVSSLTIPAGSQSVSTTFTPIDDSISDVNETISISISSITGGEGSVRVGSSTSITITDDEAVPSVSLSASSSSIAENSGSSITLTATSTIISSANLVVNLNSSGTSTSGTDYGSISSITIPAGSTTATSSFTTIDDSIYEGDETSIFDISSIDGGSAIENGSQQVTLTITENETAPTVTLTSSASSIAENSGSSVTLTATLSGATDENVTVSISTSGTGTEGTDYATISDITISAGSTTGTSTLTPTDDVIYEGSETGIVAISSVSGGSATENGTQTQTITITDNELAPTVSLSSSSSSIDETDIDKITLTATLSNATTADVIVSISTSGTATEGTDYDTILDITISAGSINSTSDFYIVNDGIYEGSETAIIAISAVSGGSASENGTQSNTITITDNEIAPKVTLSTSATTTAENSGESLTLTATLSTATTASVTVSIGTSGTASEGTDYATISDITINAGSKTGTSSFTPTDDSASEGNETATVDISGVSGGSATEDGTQSITITITDDETTPTVTLASSASSIAENSGSSLTLTATLSTTSSSNITISFSTLGSAISGTDYGTISSITISAGASSGTSSFTPTNDLIYEGSETAIVDISTVTGGDAIENGTQSKTLTITDDETAPTVTLTSSASTIAENSGSSVTLTATSSVATYQDVIVSISTSGTGTEGTDYATISDITISAGSTTGTASFTPTDDSVYEGNETGIAAISAVSGGGASENGTQTRTMTITDNESAPTVTLATSSTTTAENSGGSLTLTATLSVATTANVIVSIGTSGTATESSDYATISDITITAGNTTGTSNFTPTNDSSVEGNETATISITGVSGGSASESGSQTVTITMTDDDTTPTVTLTKSASSIAENAGSSITLTATMSTTDAANVTVAFSTSGTATEGTDYGNISNITISSGSLTGTTSFTPTNDSSVEGSESAVIAISSVSGGSAIENGTQTQTITITDDEVAPTVNLTSSATTIDEASGNSITLTATLSTTSSSNVTVGLTGTGTATAGTDYSNLSNITVTAGSLTGTTSFTPTSDTAYETSSGGLPEKATIDITAVSGGSATENSTQQVIISITEKALNSGTQLTYNSTNANTRKNLTEFKNFNYGSPTSVQNPLEFINAHKAAGYGLTGQDQEVMVMDSGFNTIHNELSDKTITTYGTLTSSTGASVSADHGAFVTGIIGADLGDGGLVGVAPNVSFLLSSYNQLDGQTYRPTKWALATAAATDSVVQNNSWGYDYQIDTLKTYISNNSLTNAQGFSALVNSSLSSLATTSVSDYVTALNNFQAHGVVVFALSNDSSFTDADSSAALPELFAQLNEAWITAINIEITGASGSETYIRKSAPCGQTAKYCLGADGFQVTGLGHGNNYWIKQSGTSFVAPMISGSIALLAEAFPNQTPEQWTTRLLASAKNAWFSHNGQVTFGNGVQHGYSTEYGHGILDIYAALNPITSSSYTASMRVATSDGEVINVPIDMAYLRTSSSFGDALIKALKDKQGIFYDALDGGFKYDLSSHALIKETDIKPFKLEQEFALLGKNYNNQNIKLQRSAQQSFNKIRENQNFYATLHASALPVQSFIGENTPSYLGFHSDLAPYYNTKNNGIGIGGKYEMGNGSRLLWGMSTPMKQYGSAEIGRNKLTSISFENENIGSYKNSFLFGIMEEDDTVLESELQGAFGSDDNKTITNFIGFSSEARLSDQTLFKASASLGSSKLNMSYSPIIKDTTKIVSDNFSMKLSHELDDKATTAVLSLSQPNRIRSGSMDIAISNLYDSDGNVTFENHNISLSPTGRQIDIGLGFRKKYSDDFEYILKYKNSINPGHVSDAESTHNFSVVSRFGDYKMGVISGTDKGGEALELTYSNNF